jgi:hypothetical protein
VFLEKSSKLKYHHVRLNIYFCSKNFERELSSQIQLQLTVIGCVQNSSLNTMSSSGNEQKSENGVTLLFKSAFLNTAASVGEMACDQGDCDNGQRVTFAL